MKISVSTLPFYPDPLEEILNYLAELNVKQCEIINEYPHDNFEYGLFDSYDMKISIHAPLSDMNPASHNQTIRNSSIAEIKKSMNAAAEMGSEVVVVHPGHIPILGRRFEDKILEYNRNSLKECSNFAQEVGIKMCVENMPDIQGLLFKDLKELEDLVLDIDAYVTLDVGHAHNNGYSAADMLKTARIEHIHLSDNDGSYDSHNALGKGDKGDNGAGGAENGIDFKSLFENLNQLNYSRALVVEVENPQDVANSLNYLENLRIKD